MNCLTARNHFNALLDRALTPAGEAEVMRHIAACPNCERALARERTLRRLLREQPVLPPSPGFAARVLRAAEREVGGGYRHGFAAGFGIAAAAVLMLWIATVSVPFGGGQDTVPAVTLMPNEARTVNLVFDSPRDLPQATIVLRLPPSMEIAGYPGRRELAWQASLQAGANAVALPIIAYGTEGGELTASIAYGEREKTFRLKLNVRPVPKAGHARTDTGLA